MTDNGQPIERAVDVLVYAPLGLAMFVKDLLPTMVAQFATRGRSEVEHLQKRLEQQLTQARVIGQFALSQGGREVGARLAGARQRGETLTRTMGGIGRFTTARPQPDARPQAPPEQAPCPPQGNGTQQGAAPAWPSAVALAIPDYDELSASQVVARLAGLTPTELDAVRAYEEARRGRKTILTRIDQLTRSAR